MKANTRRWVLVGAAALACAAMLPGAPSQALLDKPGPPFAVTGGVNHVRGTSAMLNGSVQPHGLATTYFFQYGPTVAYGAQTSPETLAAGYTAIPVAQTVVGLRLGEHYRIVAKNAAGVAFGHDRTYAPKGALTPKFVLGSEPGAPPTTYGDTFVLRGLLTGPNSAFHRVILQVSAFPYLEPFTNVGEPVTTSATGAFTLRMAHMRASTQFRVVTLDPRPTLSPVVTAKVSVRVTLKVHTAAGGLVRLYGTVTPAEVGVRVSFQLLKAIRPTRTERESAFATQFSTRTKRGTRSVSRFSLITSVRKRGYYRAYVQIAKGPLVSGTSPTVRLTAVSQKKRKR